MITVDRDFHSHMLVHQRLTQSPIHCEICI